MAFTGRKWCRRNGNCGAGVSCISLDKNELLENKDVDREISNQAKLLYEDRVFIEENVFPRGYDPEFCELFRLKWSEADVKESAALVRSTVAAGQVPKTEKVSEKSK